MNKKEIDLRKLVDLVEWENKQKILSNILRKPICTIDFKAEEIAITGELPFYTQMIKTTKNGKQMIIKDNMDAMKSILNSKKDNILLQYSRTGLLDIWVPIEIEDENVGAMGCLSILDKRKDEIKVSQIIEKTNIEYEELNDALENIEMTSQEEIRRIGSMLFVFAKTIPEILKQKKERNTKVNELTSIYNITKMINSSLDLNEILVKVIKFINESINPKNCSITILEDDKIKESYYLKKTDNIYHIENIIYKETISTRNIVKIDDIKKDFRLSNIKETYDFNSVISFPMIIKRRVYGVLNIYFEDKEHMSKFDKEFISVVADQIAMAIINAKEYGRAKKSAMKDNLTRLYNREYFVDKVKELVQSVSKDKPLSIAMLDIDDFKNYNDTNGHLKGDKLIKDIANILQKEVRRIDITGRYGGEEFIIIMPEMNNNLALNIIENIRKKIEQTEFDEMNSQPKKKITISAGLVTCMDNSFKYEEIIDIADKALYKSKDNNKNKVTSIIAIDRNLPEIDINKVNGN